MITVLINNPNRRTGIQKLVVKLINVDENGIWIEDQKLTDLALEDLGLAALPKVITVFYPFASIHAILANLPGFSLSESKFGV